MAEHHQKSDKDCQNQPQQNPVGGTSVEHSVVTASLVFSGLDAVNVLILLFGIDGCRRGIAVAFLNGTVEGLRLNGLIGIKAGIVVGELHGRYLILPLVARHHKEVVNHVALNAVGRQASFVGNLRVILVEVLREIDHRLLDELQVSVSAHHHTKRQRIVGLDGGLIEMSRDVELSDASREVGRTCRQRVNLNLQSRSLNGALHLHIAAATVEEGLERINGTVLLNHDSLEGDAGNFKLARHLGIHHILFPSDATVIAAVDLLHVVGRLLRAGDFLGVETGEVGHLSLKRDEVNQRINLI